jgi:hypothetical protein
MWGYLSGDYNDNSILECDKETSIIRNWQVPLQRRYPVCVITSQVTVTINLKLNRK